MLMLLLLHHRSCKYLSVQAVQKRFPSPELKKMIPLSLVKKRGFKPFFENDAKIFVNKQENLVKLFWSRKKKFVKLK